MRKLSFLARLLIGTVILWVLPAGFGQDGSPRSAATPPASQNLPPSNKPARQLSVTFRDGRLSVTARNCPLEDLSDMISEKSGVAAILDEGLGQQAVDVAFQDLPIDAALREILKNHDTFFFYGVKKADPASLRAVWVYAKGRGRSIAPVPPEKWASTGELQKMLADPDPEVRSHAILALIDREGSKARTEVLDVLKDTDDRVRFRTLDKVLRVRVELPPDVLQGLVQQDSSPVVRFLALNALAEQPGADPQGVKAIAEFALDDPDENIRNQAREIIDQLGGVEPSREEEGDSSQPQEQPEQKSP